MTNSLVARSESPEITVDDLLEEGFSPEEIERLKELRQEYPYIEYVDSGRQWQRLLFLKWRYAKGDLRRE
ncbi:MAG: hypothetical protein DCC58_05005 [Chloroflexi bacterium]|nr:MAG: hypothetical protein DCC58_05005 [Chloroflexota bacterium]